MHGTIMVFLAVVPLSVGAFGNYLIPLQIGAPDMAFPRLNMASYWTYLAGGLVMLASFFVPRGAANSGWTSAAKDDVWTQNQLNLPAGRPVIVHLSSKDVIHSFGLPQMRVKQDAIPGIEQRLWFTADENWRMGDCLLAAMRPRSLPHARFLHDSDAGGFRRVALQPAGGSLIPDT